MEEKPTFCPIIELIEFNTMNPMQFTRRNHSLVITTKGIVLNDSQDEQSLSSSDDDYVDKKKR